MCTLPQGTQTLTRTTNVLAASLLGLQYNPDHDVLYGIWCNREIVVLSIQGQNGVDVLLRFSGHEYPILCTAFLPSRGVFVTAGDGPCGTTDARLFHLKIFL